MNQAKPSWLVICFPACILALLMFGYFRPTSTLSSLQKSAAGMRGNTNRELVLKTTQAKRNELQVELKKLEAERQTYVVRWQDLRRGFEQTNDRPDSLDKLTTVLLKNNLHVISKQALDGNGERGGVWQQVEQRLKQPIETAFPELRTPSAPVPPVSVTTSPNGDQRTIWQIVLAGTYDDVDRALRELIVADPALTPLGVEMDEPKPELRMRRWKLTLTF